MEFIAAHSFSNPTHSRQHSTAAGATSPAAHVNEMGEVVPATPGQQDGYFPYYGYREGVLMERTQKDERGQLFAAVRDVWCDGFDCSIPVRVYANDVGGPGGSGGVHGGFVV